MTSHFPPQSLLSSGLNQEANLRHCNPASLETQLSFIGTDFYVQQGSVEVLETLSRGFFGNMYL